jgi:hypothetical protein
MEPDRKRASRAGDLRRHRPNAISYARSAWNVDQTWPCQLGIPSSSSGDARASCAGRMLLSFERPAQLAGASQPRDAHALSDGP